MSSDLRQPGYYFAYGSNMNSERVIARKMQFVNTRAGQLVDYELVFNKRSVKYLGAGAANIEPKSGVITEGVLYELSVADEILKMDPFEGYPLRYRREIHVLKTVSGPVRAWVYIANSQFLGDNLKPARWYLNHLLAGQEMLSETYFSRLSRVQCLADSEIEI
jgi:gamma-glutamylcyclotransferase (GGCT)/AIG2-like uncharacterized protein YtfP